jgi:RNA polymerase sigma-70 factor (ECF subfamily)
MSQIHGPSRLGDVADLRQWEDERLLHDTGDPAETFAEFYRRHVGAVLRHLARRGVEPQAAADLTSETFLAALARRADYRAEQPTARAWLLGIAVRRHADAARRGARDRDAQRATAPRDVVLTEADRYAYSRLLEDPDSDPLGELAELPEPQRSAVRARILDDRAYPDVARDLALSEPAARKHVSRGLASLRAQLGRKK